MKNTRNSLCFCGSNLKHKNYHNDIAFNSDFAYLTELYYTCSKELNFINQDEYRCNKGCCSCCYEHFPVYCVEFIYALYGYNNKYGENATKQLLSLGSATWNDFAINNPSLAEAFTFTKEIDNDFITSYYNLISQHQFYSKYPCLFLDNDGTCSIYEFRPLVCRQYPYGVKSKQYICKEIAFKDFNVRQNIFDISNALYKKYFINYHYEFLNKRLSDLSKPMIYFANV